VLLRNGTLIVGGFLPSRTTVRSSLALRGQLASRQRAPQFLLVVTAAPFTPSTPCRPQRYCLSQRRRLGELRDTDDVIFVRDRDTDLREFKEGDEPEWVVGGVG